MRRRAKEAEGAEYYSLVRALQALDRAEAALLVIDATDGVTRQDQRLAERVDAAGSPVVIVLNKWDLLDAERRGPGSGRRSRTAWLPRLRPGPQGQRPDRPRRPQAVPGPASSHWRPRQRRVPTGELNRLLAEAQAAHRSPGGRVLYATQGATDPPTFTLFATKAVPAPVPALPRAAHPGALRTSARRPLVFRVRRRDSGLTVRGLLPCASGCSR